MHFFIAVLFIISTLPLHANEKLATLLEWQPGHLHDIHQLVQVRFRAEPAEDNSFRYSYDNLYNKEHPDKNILNSSKAFSGQVQIMAKPYQGFTLCAWHVDAQDTLLTTSASVQNQAELQQIILEKHKSTLDVIKSYPCSEVETLEQRYRWKNRIYSDAPFLVAQIPETPRTARARRYPPASQGIAFAGSLFPKEPSLSTDTSGYGYLGSDDDDSLKRPGFLPMPGKNGFALTLLPVLRSPSDWQTYLPGTHWLHWLVGEPDYSSGITVLIHFEGHPPVSLQISQPELGELADNLLDTRQLLNWLTPRLNGKENLIGMMLELSDENDDLPEEVREGIREQLADVLEQGNTEFHLDFHHYWLSQTLSGKEHPPSPNTDILQLPKGLPNNSPAKLPETPPLEQRESTSKQAPSPSDQTSQDKQLKHPLAVQPSGSEELHLGDDYFAIVVNGTKFHIEKKQLPSSQRGQGNAARITVYKPENPEATYPLNEVEAVTGVPEQSRLSKHGSKPLNYLLNYGTVETKNALLDYYPVNRVFAQNGQLATEAVHQGFKIDETCQACNEALIARHSLMRCTNEHQQLFFHTSCPPVLQKMKEKKFSCPMCRKDLKQELCNLFNDEGLVKELHRAAQTGNRALLVALLEAQVDIDASDSQGNTALHLAAQAGHEKIVLLLMKQGANFNAVNNLGLKPVEIAEEHPGIIEILQQHNRNPVVFFTAGHGWVEALGQWVTNEGDLEITRPFDGASLLHLAAEHNQIGIAEYLLAEGSKLNINLVNKLDDQKNTPLHTASKFGGLKVVKLLLERDSDPDQSTDCGVTPLMLAAKKNHTEVVKSLLEKGATVDLTTTSRGVTALMIAVQKGHTEVVKSLLEQGATVDLPAVEGWTALMMAAQKGHTEVVKSLLEQGATVDLPMVEGWTALMIAAYEGHTEIVEILLEQGATVDLTTSNGWTALMIAAQNGHTDAIKLLLENYANINRTGANPTPLMVAAEKGHTKVVSIFLACGAEVDRTHNDFTALILAAQNGHTEVVKSLLEQGATVDLATVDGWTALLLAAGNGHTEVVKLLEEKGAKTSPADKPGSTAVMYTTEQGLDDVRILMASEASTAGGAGPSESETQPTPHPRH